jgi:hypothetical protein
VIARADVFGRARGGIAARLQPVNEAAPARIVGDAIDFFLFDDRCPMKGVWLLTPDI